MRDEIAFVILQLIIPVSQVLKRNITSLKSKVSLNCSIYLLKIDLLSSPETGLGFLVHTPDVVILDGQDHKSVRVIFQQWFLTKIHSHFTLSDVFLSTLDLLGAVGWLIFFPVREGDGKIFDAGESHFGLVKLSGWLGATVLNANKVLIPSFEK